MTGAKTLGNMSPGLLKVAGRAPTRPLRWVIGPVVGRGRRHRLHSAHAQHAAPITDASRFHGGAGWWQSPRPDLVRAPGPVSARGYSTRAGRAQNFRGGDVS